MIYFSRLIPKYTYVATSRYSKDERASLELGDTIYPYDSSVEVLLPDIKGVIVIKSSQPPEFLKELLARYYFSVVEYVTYVLSCVNCYKASQEYVVDYITSSAVSNMCFSKVRIPRTGSIDKELLSNVKAGLSKYARRDCSGTLSLEVFGATLCFGPVVYP